MAELTKEYFEQYLEQRLADLATKEDIRSINTRLDSLQETLNRVDRRDKEDSDAFARDLLNHGRRLTAIEKHLKLKPNS